MVDNVHASRGNGNMRATRADGNGVISFPIPESEALETSYEAGIV